MTQGEVLERANCAKDEKARRVLNVAPDTLAQITAEELEKGISLERLESLNVPVFRYSTQITIHGKLPDFNPDARPGGYKAVFRNQNKTIGVRYSAIDGEKKELIKEVSRCAAEGCKWTICHNSSEFAAVASLGIAPEGETERKQFIESAKALFASVPRDRFFGSVYILRGLYGDYYIVAEIGALYQADLWPVCAFFFGIADQATFAAWQAQIKAESDAKRAQWDKEAEEARKAREAKRKTLLESLAPYRLAKVPELGKFRLVDGWSNDVLTFEITGTGKRRFYQLLERNGEQTFAKRKVLVNGWPKAEAEGRVFSI